MIKTVTNIKKRISVRKRLTSFQAIILGFLGAILVGALLLMLPISSVYGRFTPFNESLFTATSAVCVTGLVVQDTGSYWSIFGQAIILILIQIGGLGIVTVAASFALISGRRISLMQRSTMQEAISAPKVGGIVKLTGFVLKATVLFEALGAIAMAPVFCRDYGFFKGIWMSIFHSVSAFCNAGFDVLGTDTVKYQSLTKYADNPLITIVIMVLIVIGGIGFLTWDDVYTNKHHFKRYRMQSKVIFVTTAALIVVPTLFFFFVDFSDLSFGKRLLSSFFQAITPRTAGFNTTNLCTMTSASRAVMIILMLIGGSPGSTAGGMKTTTVAVLVGNSFATFGRKNSIHFFKRRIDTSVVQNAATIVIMYFTLFFTGAVIISLVENIPFSDCLYETASAVGTVGLSLGITPQLGLVSQFILILLMFCGRVGGLTLIYAAISKSKNNISKFPQERITVG